ncbi:LysR family transcriptional regulator [Sphingomonas sp.]|uniref:LysR family transcriptional regulator n=1 Tax=Sphingomonas sp. TaxID=28214 RepID=UPI003B3B2510
MNLRKLDWDDLRLFLAVARGGTLTAAAGDLGLSQPTAGRKLRRLEEASGYPLFQRSAAGFRLTDEGETMFLHAERMEEEALALARQFAGSEDRVQGQLRLSASEWFCRLILAPRVAAFTLDHPLVTVELLADSRIVDLHRREADLVFRLPRFEEPEVVQRKYTHIRYALFASSFYLERRGVPETASAGEGHHLIMMDAALESQPDVPWLRSRLPQARVSVRSNSRDVQAVACLQGAGIAVLPQILGDSLGLVRVDLGEAPPGRDIRLGYHADLRRLRRLRALVDHLCAGIGEEV